MEEYKLPSTTLNIMNSQKEMKSPILTRLFIVLQSVCVMPIIIFWFIWLTQGNSLLYLESGLLSPKLSVFDFYSYLSLEFVLSHIPYLITFLGKYVVYGKFHLYKIGLEND